VAVFHPSPLECAEWIHGPDQKDELWCAKNRLAATDPTSIPSVHLSNKSSVFVSFSTSLSLQLEFRCCIDRLRSQTESGYRICQFLNIVYNGFRPQAAFEINVSAPFLTRVGPHLDTTISNDSGRMLEDEKIQKYMKSGIHRSSELFS
jgi:hypothetical protein